MVDCGNAVFFIVLYIILSKRPRSYKILTWLGFCALAINTFDGFRPFSGTVLAPSYILYPLLVLYGTLLGDIWMSMSAMTGIIMIYGYIWYIYSPLQENDFLILTNLCLLVFGSGISGLAVLLQNHRLLRKLKKQSHDLNVELDHKLRLNALIFHDIANPLSVINGTIELEKEESQTLSDEIKTIELMAKRIGGIIDSARGMATGFNISLEKVSVNDFLGELQQLFALKMEKKNLKFRVDIAEDITIMSNSQILCNSIFGNLLSNAIKFSKRGGTITLSVAKEDGRVRISVIDEGDGFSESLIKSIANGTEYASQNGTEGETGHAFGMMIASLCLHKLNASLEIRNAEKGGACASAVFSI